MGESQNGCFKKRKHAKFSEKWTFFTPWYAHVRRVLQIALRGGSREGTGNFAGGGEGDLHKEFFSIFWGFCDSQINIPYILNIS